MPNKFSILDSQTTFKMKGYIMTNIKTDRAIGLEREFDNLTPTRLQNEIRANHPHLDYLRVIRDGSLPNGGEVVFPPLSFKAESLSLIHI